MITIVAAISKNGVIGKDNAIPWNHPEDMKHFRTVTAGGTVVMGRKTYESIGRPLPKRRNIVVTKNPEYKAEGCEVCTDFYQLLDMYDDDSDVNCFIIGGADIYRLAMRAASEMVLTYIDEEVDGDVYFPDWNSAEWFETNRVQGEDPKLQYVTYRRI